MRARGFSPSNNLLKMRSLKINRLNVVAERLRLLIWHGLCLLNRSCTPCGRHRGLRTASQALIAAHTPFKYRANATIDYRRHAEICHPLSLLASGSPNRVGFLSPMALFNDRAVGLAWVRRTTSRYPVRLHVRSVLRISGLA